MFSKEIESAAKEHAIRDFPKESCGVVLNDEYVPIENIASDPLEAFEMPPTVFIQGIQAVIHSHNATMEKQPEGHQLPHHPHWPTEDDMRSQIETDVPWGIVSTNGSEASDILWWGDHRLNDDLLGRDFIPGISDCFAAVRSWFYQKRDILLPDVPRNAQWWDDGQDVLIDNFKKVGFRLIEKEEAQPGDCVFMRIHAKVPCHCGVIIDDSLLFHHLEGRLSRREPLGPWRKFITHWLRYDP